MTLEIAKQQIRNFALSVAELASEPDNHEFRANIDLIYRDLENITTLLQQIGEIK